MSGKYLTGKDFGRLIKLKRLCGHIYYHRKSNGNHSIAKRKVSMVKYIFVLIAQNDTAINRLCYQLNRVNPFDQIHQIKGNDWSNMIKSLSYLLQNA